MSTVFSKFTTHYQHTLTRALELAARAGRNILEPQDLILALAAERGSLSSEILEKHGLTPLKLHENLGVPTSILPEASAAGPVELEVALFAKHLSESTRRLVERSVVTAWRHQHHYVGTEHLLHALAVSEAPDVAALWGQLGVDVTRLRTNISSVLKSTSKFPDLTEAFAATEEEPGAEAATGGTPALDFFCTDLTAAETQGRLDPVVGREREIQRLVQILGRRTKNNPLLLGDPGVGKTAIVEGLGRRMAEGKVPEFLQGKRILALDLGLVVAGTMYRGEFEGRFKQIIEELKTHTEVILFIDEVHTIVGTGSAPGTLDLANLLKPALARGTLRCIGATTQEEYKKSIEPDAALERRFQVIEVREPSPEEAVAVLRGLRHAYEKFHHVEILDEALEAAVQLSERYVPEKFLPDKAIDLMDEAASRLRTSALAPESRTRERELEARVKQHRETKEAAIKQEDFAAALTHREAHRQALAELTALRAASVSRATATVGKVGRKEIAEVVAHATGIAVTELLGEDRERLKDLALLLGQRVVGQGEAVAALVRAIQRSRLGLGNPNRPLGSFIFLGPSGVGKTELAKVAAELVLGDPAALVRIDMSELAEAFNISKLIGAPAGYVGYRDQNKLSDLVRRRPASVVLFDEVEKAHPDVFNLLLQVLEDGQLTDAAGRHVNFKNTLIIMTSNLGLPELTREAKLGFEAEGGKAFQEELNETRERLLLEVKRFFRPEFLNRLDGVVVFNPLSEVNLAHIVTLQVAEFNLRLAREKVGLTVKLARGAAKHIARRTFSPEQGARGIRRFLQEHVEDTLTQKLLTGRLKPPKTVTVKVTGERVTLA